LYLSKEKGYENMALTIRFYRMAEGELQASRKLAASAGVREHRLIDVPQLRELSDIESKDVFRGFPGTYIPMKNAIYYSLAAAFAEESRANYIIGGHNREDSQVFKDSSRSFFADLQKAFWSGSPILREQRTTILRPLQHMTKTEVIELAARLDVPLGLTWSCYLGGSSPCWRCEGCKKRMESFKQAGIRDPLTSLNSPKV
jgi:7-cyano-7-deazaguanine synthase